MSRDDHRLIRRVDSRETSHPVPGQEAGREDSAAGDTLTLNTSCGRACWVDYDLTAPKGIKVAGRNGSGDVTLRDVGTTSIDVGSGEIRVRGASGDVSVRTNSDDVSASDLHGPHTSAHTGSGDVTLRLAAAQDVDADTGSGDVTLNRG